MNAEPDEPTSHDVWLMNPGSTADATARFLVGDVMDIDVDAFRERVIGDKQEPRVKDRLAC